jgi:hypothetical protein
VLGRQRRRKASERGSRSLADELDGGRRHRHSRGTRIAHAGEETAALRSAKGRDRPSVKETGRPKQGPITSPLISSFSPVQGDGGYAAQPPRPRLPPPCHRSSPPPAPVQSNPPVRTRFFLGAREQRCGGDSSRLSSASSRD